MLGTRSCKDFSSKFYIDFLVFLQIKERIVNGNKSIEKHIICMNFIEHGRYKLILIYFYLAPGLSVKAFIKVADPILFFYKLGKISKVLKNTIT